MRYYAIGDLHGRYDLLQKALIKINEHAGDVEHKVITLGDYIDRGPESRQVIEHLMLCGDQIICLQGNHEALAVHHITHNDEFDLWPQNGGWPTVQSYGAEEKHIFVDKKGRLRLDYSIIPTDHVKWMARLPIFYETEQQLFVHAGVPQQGMNLPPKKAHHLHDMQWMIYHPADHGGWKGKHVVHGHHQFAEGPHQYLEPKKGGRTNLDVHAYKTGRIVIGVFEDDQLHAKEFIEVKV